jgi:hypothetical protein
MKGFSSCILPSQAFLAQHLSPFGFPIATLADSHLVDELVEKLSLNEKAFGDFRSGRYAWLLQDITPLVNPIPYRGRQSIFEIPDARLPSVSDASQKRCTEAD